MTLIAAMLLDALIGEPRWLWARLPHPAVLMGRAVDVCDKRLNKGQHRKLAGALALAALVLAAAALGAVLALFGPMVEILVTAILLAHKSLVSHVRAVADGLRLSLPQGRRAVALIVSRDTRHLTSSQTARAAIESAAENLSDGVIAPAFWFLLGGLPGILVYKLVNTADSMIGYRNDRYRDFGWAAARFDDLLNLVPARLTAILFAVAGGIFDFKGLRADARLHKSPNAGWPEAALARALGIALAGPRIYDGVSTAFPWVNGTGRKALVPKDIDAAIQMMWRAWALMGIGVILLTLLLC